MSSTKYAFSLTEQFRRLDLFQLQHNFDIPFYVRSELIRQAFDIFIFHRREEYQKLIDEAPNFERFGVVFQSSYQSLPLAIQSQFCDLVRDMLFQSLLSDIDNMFVVNPEGLTMGVEDVNRQFYVLHEFEKPEE